jgi:hypothetical protein
MRNENGIGKLGLTALDSGKAATENGCQSQT